jgi:hypothetical protein
MVMVHQIFKKWKIFILGLSLVCILGILLYYIPPANLSFLPSCLLYKLTGFVCPFCGSTRAIHHLLHGNFLTAFGMNPLIIIFLLFSPVMYKYFLTTAKKHRDKQYVPILFITVLFIYGIIRNMPFLDFRFLTPK